MRFLVLVTLCLTVTCSSNAQSNDSVFVRYMDIHGDGENYRTDTLYSNMPSEHSFLVGTMMLPGTKNHISGYEYGLWSGSVQGTECTMDGESKLFGPDNVVDIQMTDSSIVIDCKISDNCCHEFLCDYEVDENGILNLIYYGYGMYCACNCCFGLTYSIAVDRYDEEMPMLTGIMINGEERTLRTLE